MGIIRDPNQIVDKYVSDYLNALKDNLISVIMYGSAVSHQYRAGKSDINTLIITKSYEINELSKCRQVVKKWLKYKVTIPFFMTTEYIQNALDVYPVEFIDISSNYKVLYGEDIFKDINFNKHHIRLQCERELRGLDLYLRTEYLKIENDKKELNYFLNKLIKRLLPIFKALLILKEKSIPKINNEIILLVEGEYKIKESIFSALINIENKKIKIFSVNELFNKISNGLRALIEEVNSFNF